MGEDSILALVGRRHHGRDHLPLCAGHVRLTKHPRPAWAIRVFMMLGLRLLTAWTLGMGPRVLIIMS